MIQTIKVTSEAFPDGVIINAEDYDPEIHAPVEEKVFATEGVIYSDKDAAAQNGKEVAEDEPKKRGRKPNAEKD